MLNLEQEFLLYLIYACLDPDQDVAMELDRVRFLCAYCYTTLSEYSDAGMDVDLFFDGDDEDDGGEQINLAELLDLLQDAVHPGAHVSDMLISALDGLQAVFILRNLKL